MVHQRLKSTTVPMFIVALFTVTKKWSSRLLINRGMDRENGIYKHDTIYVGVKQNETVIVGGKWTKSLHK